MFRCESLASTTKGRPLFLGTKELSTGEVLGFPAYREMKRSEFHGEPIRFNLVKGDSVLEVQILEMSSKWSRPGEDYGCWAIVCPVENLESREGTHAIRVIVDAENHATYI